MCRSVYNKDWSKSNFALFLNWLLPKLKFLVPTVDFAPSPSRHPSFISFRSKWSRGLRNGSQPLAYLDCGFEWRRGHWCLSPVSVVFCLVEVSASRGVLPSVVCLSVISKPQRRGGVGPLGMSSHRRKLLLAQLANEWKPTSIPNIWHYCMHWDVTLTNSR